MRIEAECEAIHAEGSSGDEGLDGQARLLRPDASLCAACEAGRTERVL